MKMRTTTTKQAAMMNQLLGPKIVHGGVSLTHDEFKSLQRYYQFHPEDNKLLKAGMARNCCRAAEHDGFRVMAVIAKYLEPDEDPVKFIVGLLNFANYDVNEVDEEEMDEEIYG